jgi:tRNA1(Val) A37 N6-methylase TrmN6
LVTATAERLRTLEIREIVYFHCDHFEPWQKPAARAEEAAAIVEFVDAVQPVEFARRLTLFYHNGPVVRLSDAAELLRAAPGDPLGFVPRAAADHDARGEPLRYLRANSDHDIQVHIHHEGFTFTRPAPGSTPGLPQALEKSREFDGARLEAAIDLWFAAARQEFGYAPERWFFVHGLWSLNASDPEGCNIGDEIARLMRKGCRGDFTFPAGRSHCDPRFEAPYFCVPASGPKAYDGEQARPEFAWGNSRAAADKFFIWNSPIKAPSASLDWGNSDIRRGLAVPEKLGHEIVYRSFRWDGVLFIKTHAHSMHAMNRDDEGRQIHPHCYGPIRDLYGAIFDGADAAGASVTFATAGEVYDRFTTAQRPAVVPPMSWFRPPPLGDAAGPYVPPTSADVQDAAARLDRLATAAIAARVGELGVEESGAGPHYATLAQRGSVLPRYDIRAAAILLARFGGSYAVDEIGTGIGTLPLLLAALGIPARGIEHSGRRYEACLAVAAHVESCWKKPPLAPYGFVFGHFPECVGEEDLSDRLAVVTDLTFSATEATRWALIGGMRRYGAVLLDLDRFIRRASSEEARRALVEEFRAAGFARIYDMDITPAFAFVLLLNNERILSARPPPLGDEVARHVPPTGADVQDAAARLDRLATEAIAARVGELGIEDSGAGPHYATLAQRGSVLPRYDIRAAAILLARFGGSHAVDEIGTGIGTLPLLLAALGIQARGIEHSRRRYEACLAVAAHVETCWKKPPLTPHGFLLGRFPDCVAEEDLSDRLAVVTDFTFNATEDERRRLIQGLRRYGAVLLDLDRFIRRASDEQARRALIAEFRAAGFAQIYDVDVTPAFAFVLLVNNAMLVGDSRTAVTPPRNPAPARIDEPISPRADGAVMLASRFGDIHNAISERLRALEIREIVYFHCDHFEPWKDNHSIPEDAAMIVEFVDTTQKIEFARRLTLFYENHPRVSWSGEADLLRAVPTDPIGFVPHSPTEHAARGAPMRYLRGHSRHEIQVHIHHETFTYTRALDIPMPMRLREETRAFDGARLECAIDLWFDGARREFDYAPERWFFVHGMWALNGSNRLGCFIEDEIARLLRKGCLGDFTFPAGNPICDPRFEAPYFCSPAYGLKVYDDAEKAEPEFAWGNRAAAENKFFIWNSPIKAPSASLDWGSADTRARLAEPERLAREIVERSFRWDGVLFVKTHAHSLHPINRDVDGRQIYPHCYGPIRDLYGILFGAAATAGVTVTFATASEVYDRFLAASPPAIMPPISAFQPAPFGDTGREAPATSGAVRHIADRIDALAREAILARIGELGVDESGAGPLYARPARRGWVLPNHDLRAAAILHMRFGDSRAVDEIGTGIGTLPLLLAALGIRARGIERSRHRYEACLAVTARVESGWEGSPLAPHDFLFGRFPDCVAEEDLSDRLAVVTDLTFNATEDERRMLIQGLRRYGAVLLDLHRFIRRASDEQARRALLAEFRAAGFARIYDMDIAPTFAFVLLVNDEKMIEAGRELTPEPPQRFRSNTG